VLSRAFFDKWFGGDPSIVGRPAALDGRPIVVTGVLPAAFHAQLPPPPALTNLAPGAIDLYHATIVRPPTPGVGFVQLFHVIGC